MRAHLSNMCLKPSGINVLFLLLSPQNKSVHRSRHKILLGRLTFNSLTFRKDLGVQVRRQEQSIQHSAYWLPGSSLMNRFSLGETHHDCCVLEEASACPPESSQLLTQCATQAESIRFSSTSSIDLRGNTCENV